MDQIEIWAKRCYRQCHPFLELHVPNNFTVAEMAGIIFVENSNIAPNRYREEKWVLNELIRVKQGGVSVNLPGFNSGKLNKFIKQYPSNSIEFQSLARSYGLFQIMGYNFVQRFDLSPKDYIQQSIEKSIEYGAKFIEIGLRNVKKPYATKGKQQIDPYEQYLRWHNTGSITGNTYDKKYSEKAKQACEAYKKIISQEETK